MTNCYHCHNALWEDACCGECASKISMLSRAEACEHEREKWAEEKAAMEAVIQSAEPLLAVVLDIEAKHHSNSIVLYRWRFDEIKAAFNNYRNTRKGETEP
jgi:hypothetical protein